jgi:glycosyltransferase involved in cell wall biosynthesis
MKKKKLLFITPVNPLAESRGRNLRAFQWVNYLMGKYEVTILCTSVYGSFLPSDEKNKALTCETHFYKKKHRLKRRILNMMQLKPASWNSNTPDFLKWMAATKIESPDVIICFRLVSVPKARMLSEKLSCGNIWLDLDELDSDVKSQIADLQFKDNRYFGSIKSWIESKLFSVCEKRNLYFFNKVFVTTADEKRKLIHRFEIQNCEVFENKLPYRETRPTLPGTPFRFLFVGHSNYYPNLDAIRMIAQDVIPEIRKKTRDAFTFVIIGGKCNTELKKRINNTPEIDYMEDTEDLETVYQKTDAVLVPLSAGGGSSFKVLEAFSYSKPVVSTPVGIRGFDLTENENVLTGQNAEQLAAQCCKLMGDKKLTAELAVNGHRWFRENYSYKPLVSPV